MTAHPGALRFTLFLVLAGLLSYATVLANADGARFTVRDGTLEGPASLAAGYHEFTVGNPGTDPYTVTVARLADGADPQAMIAAVEAVDRAFAGEGDASAALNAALELGEIYGEASAAPGGEGSVGLVFEPGAYLLFATPRTEEGGVPQNLYHSFEVVGEPQAQPPAAAQTIQMVDFAFALPPGIEAGEQVWQVVNVGQQLHHMVIFKLHEGVTMADLQAWMESEAGPPPADEAGYVGVMGPGRSAYATLDLTPGEYVAICFMPDHRGEATGQPHVMLGMMQAFTVAGG